MTERQTSARTAAPKRKLIEVSLPLEAINRESAREKSIRHGHPSTLHLWWARRPLAAARAVLFAQLVDDPSSHPERFPTEEAQRVERERLHGIIERLVVWENTRDQTLLDEAHQEILNSTDGHPPPILDPFAGGGTIPLEAQRLGLEAYASDLNPVAVLINKALIEIPPKFAGQAPVFPGLADTKLDWPDATGLAADVRAYGKWMRDEAEKRIGHHYPKVTLPDGKEATVIAWIWARTVTCPNPACGIEMPLVRSWWLGKKTGKEAWVQPIIVADPGHPSGKRVRFEIAHNHEGPAVDGTIGRAGGTCVACGSAVSLTYVRQQGRSVGLGEVLMAVAAEGERQRIYMPPSRKQAEAAQVRDVHDPPPGELPNNPRDFKTPNYGLDLWIDLFTRRQLLALTTFSDLVAETRTRILQDLGANETTLDNRLEAGGAGSVAYADAIATYLGLAVSRLADYQSSCTAWSSHPKNELIINVFRRQAIPIVWDFAEGQPLGAKSGSLSIMVQAIENVLTRLQPGASVAVTQAAATRALSTGGALVSTDPPYYNNIGYSDLSDFFYVWLRRSLRSVFPELLSTMLVPKSDELVANPYRHNGRLGAQAFFERGFRQVFSQARVSSVPGFPTTVYYAYKQSDSSDDGAISTGWETLLEGMIGAGWVITATWPMRSELGNRMLSHGTNALASSIVLSLRPRPENAPSTDRRGFVEALHGELPDALRRLQQGNVSPVDLPQAAIGPGIAVFSRYSRVIESDGTGMTVRSALARINEILDQVLNEQEGEFDSATRFAIAWYRQYGYGKGHFGVADGLARARNTSVETIKREGILTSAASEVQLLPPSQTPVKYDVVSDARVGVWEVLHHLIRLADVGGVQAAGEFLAQVESRPDGSVNRDQVKDLAYLLFHIAEANRWTQDALAFNVAATSWDEIVRASRELPAAAGAQLGIDFEQGV